jgi:hypothetical protein
MNERAWARVNDMYSTLMRVNDIFNSLMRVNDIFNSLMRANDILICIISRLNEKWWTNDQEITENKQENIMHDS